MARKFTEADALAKALAPVAERVAADVGDSPEAWRGVVLALGSIDAIGRSVVEAHPEDLGVIILALVAALTRLVPR